MPEITDPLMSIEHVVVLMLENRSFDNILGHLYGLPAGGSNRLIEPDGTEVEIPSWGESGTSYPQMTIPNPDPGEAFTDMNQQIFGLTARPPSGQAPTTPGKLGAMGGFAQNYDLILRSGEKGDPKDASDTPVAAIMNFFTEDQVPVSSLLARTFKVVDSYHAPAPCQTMPNRTFAQLATANGFVNNTDGKGVLHAPYFGPSIFGQIREAQRGGCDIDWRCYFGDFPLTLAMVDTWEQFDDTHFRFMDDFFTDTAAGKLPAYTWLEPAYQIAPADNHPPHDVTRGEALLAQVYNSLRTSEHWSKTLFILTYDEHGGCYDRVMPGAATSPGGPTPDGFNFDRYGVRVPCILISDYSLDSSNASTGPTVYDHTSILALLRERWPLGAALSPRESSVGSLSKLLTPAAEGAPTSIAVPVPVSDVIALEQQAIVDAAELIAAKLAGASLPELKIMFDNDLRSLAEQAVFDTLDPYLTKLLEELADHIPKTDLLGWLASLGAEILHLLSKVFHPSMPAPQASDLSKLVAWLADFVADHIDEHRQTPLTEERAAALKEGSQALASYDQLGANSAIRRLHELLPK